MAKMTRDPDETHTPASPASLDGYRRLALRVVLHAVKDYRAQDLLTALDALLFILDDNGAAWWLDALGVGNGDPAAVFWRLTDGKAGNKLSRLIAG